MNNMIRKALIFVLTMVVAVLAALLLAGCQQNDQKEPAKIPIQSGNELVDSLKKDSVEAFDEQKTIFSALPRPV